MLKLTTRMREENELVEYRKRFRILTYCTLIAVLVSTMLTVGCSPVGKNANTISINVCYSSASVTQSVALYAYERGLFKKYGLEVNLAYIPSGSRAIYALVSEDMDICQIAGSAIVNAAVAGMDIKIVGGLVNTYPYTFMASEGVDKVEEIKGKAIAVSNFGSASDFATRTYLESVGLQPGIDVSILPLGGQSERVAAMRSGQIVGSMTGLLQTAYARRLGFTALASMKKLGIAYQHTAIAVSSKMILADRKIVTDYLRACKEAILLMKTDTEGVRSALVKHLKLDAERDKDLLDAVIDDFTSNFVRQDLDPTYEGVQLLLDQLSGGNVSIGDFQPEDIIDTTLIQEIQVEKY